MEFCPPPHAWGNANCNTLVRNLFLFERGDDTLYVLPALFVLLLFIPVTRRVPGVPEPLRASEIASGIAWRLLLFADGALCVAIVKSIV